jgi:predicted metalloprotease
MRWQGGSQSDNVEDRRGMRGGPMVIGGGLGTIAIVAVALLLGADPADILNLLNQGGGGPGAGVQVAPDPRQEQQVEFVKVVLKDTEDVWTEQFRQMGRVYDKPKLVLFSGQVESACGLANAAVGPFYCPADQKVYLDLTFFDELSQRFRAPGDFANAYVIAHEVGHHVQNLLGTSEKVSRMRGRVSQTEYNKLSVRLELQADFLAGVWAHHAQKARQILESGDIEAGIRAASAIGDDRLQKQSRGYVVPDSFTHGTSEQRVRWFRKGFETGDIRQGDTFSAREL